MSLRAVTRQSTSPTANLLRNSRLFSLPPPLPRPFAAVENNGVTRGSDTATLPYPSQQAIATTYSGLSRGDWGLKRNLPLKSTANTSNPAIRFTAIDTIEHVTDFESAQDHVRTVEKWEELDVPMLMDQKRQVTSQPGSAFERDLDITAASDEASDESTRLFNALKEKVKIAPSETTNSSTSAPPTGYQPLQFDAVSRRSQGSRWKFDGPWIPTMAASEFTKYLENKVSQRRDEFNAYVVEYAKHKIYTGRKSKQQTKGIEGETEEEIRANQQKFESEWSRFSEKDIQSEIQRLRKECFKNPVHSELVQKLVIPFLGLPPITKKEDNYTARRFQSFTTSARTTHPSAGLGYLRTNAYMINHPILGPQANHAPVEARLLRPRRLPNQRPSEAGAKLGIGGIVTNIPSSAFTSTNQTTHTENLDLGPEGGQKIWVEPLSGSVGADGRIALEAVYPDSDALAVKRGDLVEKSPGFEGAKDYSVHSIREGFGAESYRRNIPGPLADALLQTAEGRVRYRPS
jgi:hypothetical protein